MLSLLGLAGCAERPPPDSAHRPPTDPAPDVRFDPPVADLGSVEVPCDAVGIVTITNAGAVDHRLDAVSIASAADLTLLNPLERPRVLHPGDRFELHIAIDADAPAPIDGRIDIVSDEGPWQAVLAGEVGYHAERTESFVAPLPAVDILWVVDRTGAVPDRCGAELHDGLPALVDAWTAAADWRMILVNDDSACGEGPVLTPASPDPAGALEDVFFDPGGTEFSHALLELAGRALAENASDECNREFQRDGAQLLVIAVSDDPDQSMFDWRHWVDDYFAFADVVTVAGVLDAHDTCGSGADGYLDAIADTDGVAVDLCDDDFGRDLDDLADAVKDARPIFVLAEPAVPDTVAVTVDGAPVTATLDASGVVLTLDAPVGAGAAVRVDYAVAGTCAITG